MREGAEEQELQKLSQEMGLKDINLPVSRQDLSLSSWTTPAAATSNPSTPLEGSENQSPAEQMDRGDENSIAPPGSIQVFDHPETLEVAEETLPASEPPVIVEEPSPTPAEAHPEISSEIDPDQATETQ
jgi:hypothetical protein